MTVTMPSATRRCAYVSLLTSAGYVPGAVALSHRLKVLGSPYPLYIIATQSLEQKARAALSAAGIQYEECEELQGNSAALQKSWMKNYNKLHAWALTQFERVIFIDVDVLLLKSIDSLFDIALAPGRIAGVVACYLKWHQTGERPCHHPYHGDVNAPVRLAEPFAYGINGGLFVLQPSKELHRRLLLHFQHDPATLNYPAAEECMLNHVFRNIIDFLPISYNLTAHAFLHHPNFKASAGDAHMVHFSADKPWTPRSTEIDTVQGPDMREASALPELVAAWWTSFDDALAALPSKTAAYIRSLTDETQRPSVHAA